MQGNISHIPPPSCRAYIARYHMKGNFVRGNTGKFGK